MGGPKNLKKKKKQKAKLWGWGSKKLILRGSIV
jgi:hypothetical protein